MRRTDVRTIRDILRHRHELGLTLEEVAAAVGVAKGTVSHTLKRAAAAGLTWPLSPDLEDSALNARLFPSRERRSAHLQPAWNEIVESLQGKRGRRRARLTYRQLWVEYRDEAQAQGRTAYSYSRFCKLLDERVEPCRKPQMRFTYEPGLYGMSDFSGKTLALQGRDVEIFVAVLPHSHLIYVEATPDQTVGHWTMAHRRALEYFGGVPRRWIIDNLKSGVTRHKGEEIHLNPSFQEFARHYDIAVLPARPGKASDKGPVEASVGAVQSRILLPLRDCPFFSLEEMNAAIRKELETLNNAPMARSKESRCEVFDMAERNALRPLPERSWEWGEWLIRTVAPDCHVRINHNLYSVPWRYVGRRVNARVSEQLVEVFLERGGEKIAAHAKRAGRNQFATCSKHMPDHHRAVRGIRDPDYQDFLLGKARRIGKEALSWAECCMASRDYPEQAFRSVQGMIGLVSEHGNQRVNEVCIEALARNRFGSGFLRDRLKEDHRPPRRAVQSEKIPDHRNIRGPHYYSSGKAS